MSDDVSEPDIETPAGYEVLNWRRGFTRQIGPLYRKLDETGSTMAFRVEEQHSNGMLNAHGGMLMTLADMAWGQIVSIETSSYWVTIRLMCDFLSSAKAGDWVEARGEVMSRDNGLFLVRGRVWTGDRALMTGTGLFKPIQKRDPRPGEKAFEKPAS